MATITCGTGSGNFPQPGDPDLNNSILNAAPAFGGIDVTWTYPELLPEAVAHVRLYRSTNADPATAVLLRRVSGELYHDTLDPLKGVTYYYWIKIVSVNGTIGDLIGPASAVARPTIEQTIEMLSGQINDSHLAQSLRDNIQRIDLVNTRLDGEVADRVAQYEGVLGTLNAYQADVEGTATLLADEVSRLDTADTAQINQINILGARAEDNEAMLLDEQRLRADADQAMGEDLRILSASMGIESQVFFQPAAPIPSNPGDRWIDTDNGNAPKFWSGSEWVTDPEITGTVYRQTEPPTNPVAGDVWFDSDDGDKAYQFLDGVWEPLSIYDGNLISAAVQNHNNTRIGYCMIDGAPSPDIGSQAVCKANGGTWLVQQALADAVKGIQITDSDGDSASVEERMVSYKNDIGQLLSEYTVKVQTDTNGNKIVGGFGLTADGATVEAGFDVDRFWVGKLGNKRFPFIIDANTNEVFMDEAAIRHLTFTKLRDEAGNFMVVNGKLKAKYIEAGDLISQSTVTVGPTTGKTFAFNVDGSYKLLAKRTSETGKGGVVYDEDGISVYDEAGTLRVKIGKLL